MTMHMRWFALGAAAIALGACSDTTTSPLPRGIAAGSGPSLSATLNGNSFTILSDASSQYCASAQVNGNIASFPASFAPVAGCGAARDLQADGSLTAYNPGWENPTGLTVTTAHWIGFDAKSGPSSDYRANVGEYVYQQTFTLPANVTAPTLSLDVMADNVVAVYLNGHLLGSQAMVDCNTNPNTFPCHWTVAGKLHVTAPAADFNAPGVVNTLTFLVVDLATGFPSTVAGVGGTAPQWACGTRPFQTNGTVGFTATLVPTSPNHVIAGGGAGTLMTNIGLANQAGCENPTGLVFAGTVSWTPQVCDFITFGRLVTTVGDNKVVISGNAGGNAPDGGILGEIEISIGGVDYHVHTIDTYGPTTNAPLFPDPFARVITGKSGTHTIELRLRDNPNPGQGEPGTQEGDKVWLKIDGVVVVPTQTLDQGNIQLHLNCRGPGD